MKILQINIDRGGGALDLMSSMVRNEGYDICMIGEPHRRRTADWFGHEDAKILVSNGNLFIRNKGVGVGHSWMDIEKIRFICCYISPNSGIQELENILEDISTTISGRENNDIVVAGDFNAKSWEWGSPRQDRRGELVSEWAASLGLVIQNNGICPTFRRGSQESHIDITLTSEGIAAKIQNWMVLDNVESLSLHQYISYEIADTTVQTDGAEIKGWKEKTLDCDELRSQVRGKQAQDEVELTQIITAACDKSMKLKRKSKRREVYWWNNSINDKRKDCISIRRSYTRQRRRNGDSEESRAIYANYQREKKNLKIEIQRSKTKCWKELCQELEKDVWGEAYKIVTKKIGHLPPKIPPDIRKEQINKLFPENPSINWRTRIINEGDILEINSDELLEAVLKLTLGKAPGPDYIPTKVLREVVLEIPDTFLRILNRHLKDGTFPRIWKEARIVLLEKPRKNQRDPPAYRPVCLLNTMGKLFEGILNERIKKEIQEKDILSDKQFGFRKGRSTVDAIKIVTELAGNEIRKRGDCRTRKMCILTTLDIRNAFNTANWEKVIDSLQRKGISQYLIKMMEAYLCNREIRGENFEKNMSGGVPQGSILGPTLWNIFYDDVIRLEVPEGVTLVAYADDLAIVTLARDEEDMEFKLNFTLEGINNWMVENKLQVAPEKSEAIVIAGRKKYGPINIKLGGQIINIKNNLKYLGVVIDNKLSFLPHLEHITTKAEKTVAALSRIVPNLGGPGENKRRMLQHAADSILLYASPVWVECLKVKKNRYLLLSRQRKFCLRVACAYRTVSTEAASVISRVIPIDLACEERNNTFGRNKEVKDREREITLIKWQERWRVSEKGQWTKTLIPEIGPWFHRKFGEINYHLTQALSGHGCFQSFIHKIGKAQTPKCLYCEENDNPEHTFFGCVRWEREKEETESVLGEFLTKENLVSTMLQSESNWKEISNMITKIMKQKEELERRLRAQQASQ